MLRKLFILLIISLIGGQFSTLCRVRRIYHTNAIWKNDIPPRLQWNANSGYCGEVSLICAGLYYGQYVSQYDARAIATKNVQQNKGQLLLGKNDKYTATEMRLNAIEWNTASEQDTDQFLAWVKQNVVKGYPVAIGIFTNEYLFYHKTNRHAGDSEYDHIVPVIGIESKHPLIDPKYYSDDVIFFSDNGLWNPSGTPQYLFDYAFDSFQATREQANDPDGSIYSLADTGSNYGIAITGVVDIHADTLPVRVYTDANYEKPAIKNGSNKRPQSMPLTLTITISGLKPGVRYNVYKYNDFDAVPDSEFNAHAGQACQKLSFKIASGSTYTITDKINSNDIAVYRAVKATAP